MKINKSSIFFNITTIFIISIVLTTLSFFIIFMTITSKDRHINEKLGSYLGEMAIKDLKNGLISQQLRDNALKANFLLITDKKEQDNILNDTCISNKLFIKDKDFSVFKIKRKLEKMAYIKTKNGSVILKNNTEYNTEYGLHILATWLLVVLSLVFSYMTIVRKLKPLKILSKKMKEFGNENFDIDFQSSKKDEISQLANEFAKTANKLKDLKESRNIFIRNIMHELKTPIAKGNFLVNLPKTAKNNVTVKNVFNRLETLINEFAQIEQLMSTQNCIARKEYFLDDIIDNATDILMSEDNQLDINIENIKLNVDFKLFSIAIKNLVDNAIKNSPNKNVIIKTQGKAILFENYGNKLKYPIDKYFEPFFKDSDKTNDSFGLGLYIVKYILDAHNYSISYAYQDEKNIFKIKCAT